MSASTINLVLLLALSASWGSVFPFIKVAEHTITPVTMMAIRAAIAAVILVAVSLRMGKNLRQNVRTHVLMFFIGVLATTCIWLAQAWGELTVASGITALFATTIPIFTFIVNAVILRRDRVTALRVVGLAIGVCGLAVAVGPQSTAVNGTHALLGLGILLAGFLAYAVSGLMASWWVADVDPYVTTTLCLLYGALTLIPLAFVLESPLRIAPSAQDAFAVAWIALVGTALPTLLYYLLLRRAGPFFASLFGYLVPLFGMSFGVAFLHEAFSERMALGMMLVLGGLWVLNRPPSRKS